MLQELVEVPSDWLGVPRMIPRLSDPDDEPLLQMAVEAKVPTIATRNIRHLKTAETFGIEVMKLAEFLAKLRRRV